MHEIAHLVIDAEAILRSERYAVCMDLGTKASDIVQANAVIWVEGPSDRLYLNHWIRAFDDELVEGIHYSIMFYGGRLLSHLSADDDEVKEFINLRALNQNIAILIDSDKSGPNQKMNATKNRLKTEFAKGRGVALVTKGREIENYVDHVLLQEAVKKVYPSTYSAPRAASIYDHALYFERIPPSRPRKGASVVDPIETKVDKVKVVHEVCRLEADLDILDLRARIADIVEMIHSANP